MRFYRKKLIFFAVAFLLMGCDASVTVGDSEQYVTAEAKPVEWADVDWIKAVETLAKMSVSPSLSNFSTLDLNGNCVTQDIFLNSEITIINVWDSSCRPCLDEMRDLGRLARAYRDEGLQVIGLVTDIQNSNGLTIGVSRIDQARRAVEAAHAGFLQLLPSNDFIAIGMVNVRNVPVKFIVDKQGELMCEPVTGTRTYESIENIILKYLE